MKTDLIEAFKRLQWCNGEIDEIENTVSKFVASKPYRLKCVPLVAETTGAFHLVLKDVEPFPFDVQQRSGTTVNELRSILNSLVAILSMRNGHNDLRGIDFPVANDRHSYFNDKEIRKKIRKLSDADKALIETLEPWKGGNDLLHALHGTDVARKHRLPIEIIAHNSGLGINNSKRLKIRRVKPCAFEEGGIIATIEVADSVELSELKIVPTYSEPPFLKGKSTITILRDFSCFVNKALELFN